MTLPPGCRSTVDEKLAWAGERWPGRDLEAAGIVLRICRSRDLFTARSRRAIDDHGLAPAELESLIVLLKQPPPHHLTPGAIGSAIGVTSGGMTKVLNKLVERDLVSRIVAPEDRRSRLVRLTGNGAAVAEAALGLIIEQHTRLLTDTLSADERRQFTALLEKLLGVLEGGAER